MPGACNSKYSAEPPMINSSTAMPGEASASINTDAHPGSTSVGSFSSP